MSIRREAMDKDSVTDGVKSDTGVEKWRINRNLLLRFF